MSVHVHYFTKTALRHLRELIQTNRESLSRQGSWFPSYSTDETSDQSTQYHEQSFFLRSMAIVVPSFAIKKYIQQWLVEEAIYLGIEVITLDELAVRLSIILMIPSFVNLHCFSLFPSSGMS